MPRIKAYVSDDCIIPVSSAVVDDVYQCKKTKQIYRSKDAFVEHLKLVRAEIHENISETDLEKVKETLWNLSNFNLVFDYINSNPIFMFDPAIRSKAVDYYFKITQVSLSWTSQASNSHCAPRGKIENWNRNNELPLWYPGWVGRMHFEYRNPVKSSYYAPSISKNLEKLSIHVGMGGATYKDDLLIGSYSVTMFADDWKPACEDVLAEQTMVLLADASAQFYRSYTYE